MLPLNTLHVARTPDEIDADPTGDTICSQRMVFYREVQSPRLLDQVFEATAADAATRTGSGVR